jgi:flagellin
MQIGEGASNEISSMLQRQRELAVQASNDTLSSDQRQALNTEYQNLTQEIDRTANSSQFNTQGTANGTGLASGAASVMVGANAGEEVTLPAFNVTAANLGVTGTDITSGVNARSAINQIDNALSNLNSQRADVGSMMNRFEHTSNNLQNQAMNTQAAESVIRDMDFAVGVADMVRNQLLNQAGTMALRNFNQVSSQNMMSLLR